MANPCTVLTLTKRFNYRENPLEEWGNTYHFLGQPPITTAEWDSLANQVWNLEKPAMDASIHLVRATGHSSSDPGAVAVYEHDYTTPGPPPAGSFVTASAQRAPGDAAAVIQWLTNIKSARGKPIYLRKYFHGPYIEATNPDLLDPGYLNAVGVYAQAFINTPIWGGLTNAKRTAAIVSIVVQGEVTTRTLKRRGKRKKVA